MKKIQFAILKEIFPLFVLGNLFFVFILLLEQLVELAELFIVRSIPMWLIAQTILFYMPSLMIMTIPISTLLGTLLAFSRFSADSELIAMRASGASGKTFLFPTLIFGLFALALSLSMSLVLLPKGSTLAINNINKMLENFTINDIREKEMYEDIPGIILFVNKKLDNQNFNEILVINKQDKLIVSSKEGTIAPNSNRSLLMDFRGGRATITDRNNTFSSIGFGKMQINLPLNIEYKPHIRDERLMDLSELKSNFSKGNSFKFEYSKRFALPLSSVIFAIFGLSLGIFIQRSGRSMGIVVSCAIAFLYNFLFIFFQGLAGSEVFISPFLLAWLPNIICLLIMIPFLRKVFL